MYLLVAILAGFLTMRFLSNPRSRVRRKLPTIRIKRLEICPYVRISIRGRIIHFHHWLNFTLLLVISIVFAPGILAEMFPKGFLLGGIIQGFFLPEARKLVYRPQESHRHQPK